MKASHAILALCALGLLAGCLSPPARCFAEATADYRAIWRAARALEADLARGYALHRSDSQELTLSTCRAGGTAGPCLVERPRVRETPVAIDIGDHQSRLAALQVRLEELRPAAMAAAAPCGHGDWTSADHGPSDAVLQP